MEFNFLEICGLIFIACVVVVAIIILIQLLKSKHRENYEKIMKDKYYSERENDDENIY